MMAATEAIRIGSAAQLRHRLESPELGFRLAALNAIQQQPSTALALGLHDGEDAIDMLLTSAKRTEGTLEWLYYVIALTAFRDARVTDFYTNILATSTDSELLFTAAGMSTSDAFVPSHRFFIAPSFSITRNGSALVFSVHLKTPSYLASMRLVKSGCAS